MRIHRIYQAQLKSYNEKWLPPIYSIILSKQLYLNELLPNLDSLVKFYHNIQLIFQIKVN